MELLFEYVNIPKNNYFEYLVEEKLNPLAKKFPFVLVANVFFKVENSRNDLDNICKIKLETSKSSLFAFANEESIEEAIQKTSKALELQLKDRNENN
ncbi:HPF/RaiA family ribosome-associated protein [Formosa sp. PL04]|uniref:HPF/RaiA family ribosome-associated protein n=1 Tax=Formosa sp. PL04 TaxID=3081755 RepID=UPI002981EDAA|nr:HPF/RaiA family ribosome-associated protein [Formosa sp. PL04]MDW5290416.1 HPF/RaiA family ribosome-associated protein [Formosa sp. PL04]